MSAITLSDLSWSAPNGRVLFSSLDLTFGPERTGIVGRNGVGKSTLLQLISGDLTAASGHVSRSGTLGVLRQTVQVDPDETVADLFGVGAARPILRRAEAGEATLDDLADADWTLETRMAEALAHLGLDIGTDTRLAMLSGGQRTRAGLAALVFMAPDFLLLDEPTNTLDRDGRQAIFDLLTGWKKGAIVVSHDRELLESMDTIIELTALGATRYGGNWSQYSARKAQDLAAAQTDLAEAEKRSAEVARNAQTAAERQRTEAIEAAATARRRIEVLQPLSVILPSARLAPGRSVVTLDTVTAGYALNRPVIRDMSFAITGPERIAITGPNGSGKTTLLAVISGRLIPWSGTVRVTPDMALLDQSVSFLDPPLSIRENFRRLHPDADENACRAALARFMFRADAALQRTGTLSGGQLLRAGLACATGGASAPSLLILDEPTNHLDIDSIAAVEAGLRAYDGALLIVSHDETFLEAIRLTRRLVLT